MNNERLFRCLLEHLAQLLYDSEGEPIEGWEEIAEMHQNLPGNIPSAQEMNRAFEILQDLIS